MATKVETWDDQALQVRYDALHAKSVMWSERQHRMVCTACNDVVLDEGLCLVRWLIRKQ